MQAYHVIQDFLSPEEVLAFGELIDRRQDLFKDTSARTTPGPRYRVIDGEQIQGELPQIAALGEERVRPAVEDWAGQPLKPLNSPKRSMRVQLYERKDHGFQWHIDSHSYIALACLKNSNRGETQIVPPGLSRVLKFLRYPLYAVPRVFEMLPREGVTLEAGDLFVMAGGSLLHRSVTPKEEGERTLLVYSFDEPHKNPSRLKDFMARKLNL